MNRDLNPKVFAILTALVEERTDRDLAELTGLGVRIVGDPALLRPVADPADDPELSAHPSVGLPSAVRAVTSVASRADEATIDTAGYQSCPTIPVPFTPSVIPSTWPR